MATDPHRRPLHRDHFTEHSAGALQTEASLTLATREHGDRRSGFLTEWQREAQAELKLRYSHQDASWEKHDIERDTESQRSRRASSSAEKAMSHDFEPISSVSGSGFLILKEAWAQVLLTLFPSAGVWC